MAAILNERNNVSRSLIGVFEPIQSRMRYSAGDAPLHVTLVPWFTVQETRLGALRNALSNKGHEIAPVKVTIESNETKLVVRSFGAFSLLAHQLATVMGDYGATWRDDPLLRDFDRLTLLGDSDHLTTESKLQMSRIGFIAPSLDKGEERIVEQVISLQKGLARAPTARH